MTRINETVFTNNHMQLKIISTVGDRALLARTNDNSFIVVAGLNIKEDFTCDWAFAYGYFESYDHAYTCYMEKVIKEFSEYAEQ